jgi:hypothetical protein
MIGAIDIRNTLKERQGAIVRNTATMKMGDIPNTTKMKTYKLKE